MAKLSAKRRALAEKGFPCGKSRAKYPGAMVISDEHSLSPSHHVAYAYDEYPRPAKHLPTEECIDCYNALPCAVCQRPIGSTAEDAEADECDVHIESDCVYDADEGVGFDDDHYYRCCRCYLAAVTAREEEERREEERAWKERTEAARRARDARHEVQLAYPDHHLAKTGTTRS